jgi:arsenite methyltransferase
MVRRIQAKLLAAEVMKGLKKIDLPGIDFAAANQMAKAALAAVQKGHLGYAIITTEKPQ